MTTPVYPFDSSSLPRRTEVADYSSTDHEFSWQTGKGLLITCGSGGGNVVLRFSNDDTDRTFSYPAGTYHFPGNVSHIRNTGTTATQVVGLIG